MSFSSAASIELPINAEDAYNHFSSIDTFKKIAHLAPNCLAVDVNDSNTKDNLIDFVLHETASFLGFTMKIRVMGSQEMRDNTHVYKSQLESGFVVIHKTRTFKNVAQHRCLIEEEIRGTTAWYMKAYVQKECRRAHTDQVAKYATLIP